MPKLSLIIPTYNERENLPVLLENLSIILSKFDKEVIVVDDNSTDKTWELAKDLKNKYPWLRVIRRMHERGLSSAVLTGFSVAEGEYFIVMDADLQHDENALLSFMDAFEKGAKIVVGSRKIDGGRVENWSNFRKMLSYIATIAAKIALRHPVSDPMSGFFGIHQSIYQAYKDNINPRGFKILLEFLARSKGACIKEVGYTFRGRIYGESKLTKRVILDYIKALYELSLGKYISLRFLKYTIVGTSGLIVSNLCLFFLLHFTNITSPMAVSLSIEASIISNYLLNNHWTFREVKLKGFVNFSRGLLTFHAICFAGAFINQTIALKQLGMTIYGSNALGYIIAAIWNYMINVNITWRVKSY